MFLRDSGHLSEARALLEELIAAKPENHDALVLLGQICSSLADHAAAIGYLEKSQIINPNKLDTLFSLGAEYYFAGRCQEALNTFERLISLLPDFAIAQRYRGLALFELGRDHEAINALEKALTIDPDYAEAMESLANLLMKHYRFDEAERLLKSALEIRPDLVAIQNDLGRFYQLQGRFNEAIRLFRYVLELEPDNRIAVSNILYSLCYLDTLKPEKIAEEHVLLADRYFPFNPATSAKVDACRLNTKKLRIGYISDDFCTHSVTFFLEPILMHHDHQRFQIFCYSNRNVADETSLRLMNLNVIWRNIFGVGAENVAAKIKADGVDVLVDLSGHTARNRLDVCVLKPAPVLATWLGYPHSTGMRQFDYYISDSLCDPPGMTDHLYREEVWRLPRIFCSYLPPTEFPTISPPPHESSGQITFGSFNNLAKASDSVILLWSAILKKVKDSRLFIKSAALGGHSTQQNLLERFSKFGIPEERIVLRVHTPTPLEHLHQYAHVDIALDTYPYHGTTTTCESLWMGVPVITLAGDSHVSRVGVSLLTHAGLQELIAFSPEEYVAIAVKLAQDKERLNFLRYSLRAQMAQSPLMDAAGVTKEVEKAYLGMYNSVSRNIGQGAPCLT